MKIIYIEKINEFKKVNPNIRTYLGASKEKEEFYQKNEEKDNEKIKCNISL